MKIELIFFLLFLAEAISEKEVPKEPMIEALGEDGKLQMHEAEMKHLREERQPQRRLVQVAGKKLKHVETGKCLDFAHSGFSAYGLLVNCGSTGTEVKVRSSPNGGGFKTFEIVDGLQEGKCLDSFSAGSYPCDGTTNQDWQKTPVGTKIFTLQDQFYGLYLDDWSNSGLDMDDYNPGCTCQHWKLV